MPANRLAVLSAQRAGELSRLHSRLFFLNPRPILELYDLEDDPYELENLARRQDMEEIEQALRLELEKWLVRESDYLPLPTHVLGYL